MGKKKKRKNNTKVLMKTIEIPIFYSESQFQEQHFELFPFPLISLHKDYNVYHIVIKGEKTAIGYLGVFIKSGKFNYVIIRKTSEINETQLLLFLKNFIKNLGLIPMLNPHIEKYL